MTKPRIIEGGLAIDDRGAVSFVNDFNFPNVKRFYQVENFSKGTIRAFHGHKLEEKYAYVVQGSALINLVKIDDAKKPNKSETVNRFVVSSKKPGILYIPSGYANGFKSLEENTILLFFSTKSLEDSEKHDDYRYPYDYWGKDIWEVENR